MSERYICIHGHFYQPPRENPWLEAIELQDSAFPYHDWNERITAECYAPNGSSRILDAQNRIVRIVNNYGRISFNFGPTLLDWLEHNRPETYERVLQGERESTRFFKGHGSAMAQAYNHPILPLSSSRDKRTQVRWGLRDFERRFGRPAEGMWLPETAVDLESLSIMAEYGVRYTVLAPHQARRIRESASSDWVDVSGSRVDPTRPYIQRLPNDRQIAIFFYDGPISQSVAFDGLLKDGNLFASRLLAGLNDSRTWPQIVHIATDGETYGHHHRHGDMALAYALDQIVTRGTARLVNYSQYLALHPPTAEVEIAENTSWSCAHGVERWRSDCGCHTGGEARWNQAWRKPLREALDWLRECVDPLYERAASELLRDPWAARDDYIDVILDRTVPSVDRFFAHNAVTELTHEQRVRALELLELQRHALLMYTSCGWFFNDLSGIETVQVLEYAGRVTQLAHRQFSRDLEPELLERLALAKSNVPEAGDGREIYLRSIRPDVVDLRKVAAHYAISSVFEPASRSARVYCYSVDLRDEQRMHAGTATLLLGRAQVESNITREAVETMFGVLHLGDHNINGGVREMPSEAEYARFSAAVSRAFSTADLPAVIRLLDTYFPEHTYSLKSLFRDEQRRLLDRILQSTLSQAEESYRTVYESHAPLMRFLAELENPMPMAFLLAAAFVLNTDLRRAFSDPEFDVQHASQLLEQAQSAGVELEADSLRYALEATLVKIAERLQRAPSDAAVLARLLGAVTLAQSLPFEVDLWKVQNIYYEIAEKASRGMVGRAASGDGGAKRWVEQFRVLGDLLSVAVV